MTLAPTVAETLAAARARLAPRSDTSALDAEVLLAHLLGRTRAWLRAFDDQRLDPPQAAAFEQLLVARERGVPVAYLTGRREFWSLELEVGPATLVPRPETELLVEALLERLPADIPQRVADLGTGSGAIALAIAHERPGWEVVATDASPEALAVARRNAARLGLGNVTFREGDWCAPLAGERFHAVVSNPPYVPAADPHLGQGDVVHEPRTALTPGPEGLEAIRRIVAETPAVLRPRGWLLLEHGYDQGPAVADLLSAGGFLEVFGLRDSGGQPRVSGGRWP